jgi:hypothetical protein
MWRAISIGVLSTVMRSGLAAQSVLVPGLLLVDCRSVLRVGIVTCGERTADSDGAQSVSEAHVTEYLAEYGKPPREAVRALLDPTDDNIAAWIRQQRRVTSIATYVATRMTEMQSQLETEPLDTTVMPVSRVPAMVQMRATLFLNAASESSQQAANALQQVVGRYPSVDARIVQVGSQPERQRLNWQLKLDPMLPISIVALETISNLPLPSLLIEDLRYQTRLRLDATNITAQQICNEIIALRIAAETHRRRPQLVQPSP